MVKVPSSAVTEAARASRVYALGRLIEFQAGTGSEKLVPLSAISDGELSIRELRSALGSLYREGLIRAGGGGYRVTQKGQRIYRVLQLKRSKRRE
jgi:hypothetical protein